MSTYRRRFEGVTGGYLRPEHVAIFLAAVLARGLWWLQVGTIFGGDAPRYINWCTEFSLGTLFGTRAIVYSGYWLPYCGWLNLSGGWIDGWIGVQLLLSALTCVVVYETGRYLLGNTAGLVAGGLFVVQWQVFRWFVRPQSEFMMAFVFAVAMWRLVHYHTTPTTRNRLLALASLGLVAIVRPNGLPIVFGYLVWDFFPEDSARRLGLFFSSKVNLAIAGVIVSGIAYRLYFGWSRGSGSILVHWRDGIIVTPERVVYEYTPAAADSILEFFVVNLPHVLVIVFLRAVWFFSPVFPTWSTGHMIQTGLTLTPLLIGAALGIYTAARHDRDLLILWGTPLVMMVVTAMGTWVAGWRNFLGPAAVVYALFTGYYVARLDPLPLGNPLDRFRSDPVSDDSQA
mgnify:CR=1 FL=1